VLRDQLDKLSPWVNNNNNHNNHNNHNRDYIPRGLSVDNTSNFTEGHVYITLNTS